MSDLFTNNELDELERKNRAAFSNYDDAMKHQVNRLQARVDHLEALEQRLRAAAMDDFDRIADLEEESERLTAALTEIRDHPEEDGVADSMEAIAREALTAAQESDDE